MNIREGRMGAQEGAAAGGIALSVLAVFAADGAALYERGNAAYLSGALGAVFSLGVFLLARRAMGKLGVDSLFELLCRGMGEVLGRIGSLLLIGGLVIAASSILSRFMGMLARFAFPDTAPWLLLCYLAPAAGALAWMGLESIGRTARIFCFPLLLCLLAALFLGLGQYEVFRLLPLPGDPLMVVDRGFREIWIFLPALIGILIAGRGLQGGRSVARAGIAAVAVGGGAAVLSRLCLGMAYDYRTLAAMDSPLYRLTMSARSSGYFPRLDKLLLFAWAAGGILAAGFCQYGAALLWCQVFRQRDARPAALLMAGLSAALCLLAERAIPWLVTALAFLGRFGFLMIGLPVLLAAAIGLLRKPARQAGKA